MQDRIKASVSSGEVEGVRDLQARLYRDIGISAVAAALQSIRMPEPSQTSDPSPSKRRESGMIRVA